MKVEKIKYEQLFPTGEFQNQRYAVEIKLEEGDFDFEGSNGSEHKWNNDAAHKAFLSAKLICEETFKKLNPHVGEVQYTNQINSDGSVTRGVFAYDGFTRDNGSAVLIDEKGDPKASRIEIIERDIMSCKDKVVLESYRLIAKTDKRLEAAYVNKMGEFV